MYMVIDTILGSIFLCRLHMAVYGTFVCPWNLRRLPNISCLQANQDKYVQVLEQKDL